MESARSTSTVTAPAAASAKSRPVTTRRTSGGKVLAGGSLPAVRLAPQQAVGPGLSPAVAALVRNPGSGAPLVEPVRRALESTLQVPLAPVLVHTDPRSAAVVDAMGVRAFTYGLHIFLGSRESASDLDLMGHEVAHVVQQQGKPVLQAAGGSRNDAFEREAGDVSRAASEGRTATVEQHTTGARVQALWPLDEAAQWVEEKAWGFVQQYAPELVEIIRKGPLEYLKEKISQAIETVFSLLLGPVRALTGLASSLQRHFQNLVGWMTDAAAKIAQGDCRPLTEAAEKMQHVVEGIAAPIIDDIKKIAKKTTDFFSGLWERFGAPAVDFLKRVGGEAWAGIQAFGNSVWEKTAPIRATLSSAWTWIKNKLGIGEGAEGQNGILQWVQAKASEAWEWLKVKLEPIKVPLMIVGGVLLLLSPAGPLLIAGAAVTGLMTAIRWVRENMRKPNSMVDQRSMLERTIIPGMLTAVDGVSGAMTKAATFISGKLTDVAGGLGKAAGAAAASVFRFAVSLLQWLADQFIALMRWANEKLMGLAQWMRSGLARLKKFFEPILGVLKKVGEVYMNLMQLPSLVAGALWKMIPACIRDPFVNFLINQILKRIPFFSTITAVAELWMKLKDTALRALKQLFQQGDVMGAIITVFKFMLETLGIPPDLVAGIFTKAASALDLITRDPVGFLKNVLLSFKQGFMQFFKNIGKHLFSGVTGWLFGALASAGITVPTEISFKAILKLVMQILGVTLENVLARMAKNSAIGAAGVAKLKKIWNTLTGVWEFVSALINEGPAGMWKQIKEHLSSLWSIVLGYITEWLIGVLIKQATLWLLSFVDPTFIMSIVNSLIAIYRAVMTFMERLREMLEIVNSALTGIVEIAKGVITRAADALENAMSRSLPVIIAFLADQCGMAGIGRRIGSMIGKVQEKINLVIDKIIEKAVQLGSSILSGIKTAAGAVLNWWQGEREVLVDGKVRAIASFDGTEESAALKIASSPKRGYVMYLDEMASLMITPEQKTAHAAARKDGEKLEGIQRASRKKDATDAQKKVLEEDFGKVYAELQKHVAAMLAGTTLPASQVIGNWGGQHGEVGGTSVIVQLSSNDGGMKGGPPVAESPVWKKIKDRKRADGSRVYIRGHLLNENLYGPGTLPNLTPITRSANATHESKVEIGLKRRALDVGRAVRYEIKAVYGGQAVSGALSSLRAKPATDLSPDEKKQKSMMEAELGLATSFTFVAYTLKSVNGVWQKHEEIETPSVSNVIPEELPPITGDEE